MGLLSFRSDRELPGVPDEKPGNGRDSMPTLPYGRQEITSADLEAVLETLRSDFITQGPSVPAFEAKLADYCEAMYAVAVNSATSALHVACLALDVGPGDLVWTTPLSFVASANCARYCGADVGFVDVDPATGNLSVAALRDRLTAAQAGGGRLPKVVIVVHLAGQPCDMRGIAGLAAQFGFRVIEDASHAIGARYEDKPVGHCTFSDITVFSFHPVKIVTTAEGGMAVTQDAELHARMQCLRNHGIDRSAEMQARHPEEPWFYEQTRLGFNYRLPDVLATLGISQLDRLDAYVDHRHHLVERYADLLRGLPLRLPSAQPGSRSSWHLYAVSTARAADAHGGSTASVARRRLLLFQSLREQGIGVAVHYIPIHTQPYYRQLGFGTGDFPVAEAFYAGTLSLPMFGSMTFGEQDRVVQAVARWVEQSGEAGESMAA